jgi:hypothetical protein
VPHWQTQAPEAIEAIRPALHPGRTPPRGSGLAQQASPAPPQKSQEVTLPATMHTSQTEGTNSLSVRQVRTGTPG